MSILEGAYWISFRQPRKYLKADTDGSVWGVDPGPRGLDVLDSAALRARIWLAEKATDGQSFRFRNYETGSSLDGGDQDNGDMARVIATRGCTEGQLWDVIPLKYSTEGPMYQIKNVATSTVLGQSGTAERRYKIILDTSNSQKLEGWLIEPVLLPTLYSITNLSHENLALCAPYHSNVCDDNSGAIKLQVFSPEQPTRNHLWMLEYISLNEAIVRSASYNRFVLDLASDSQTVLARKCHGGLSQRWTVKYEGEDNLSLVNAKTGTLLGIQQQQREVFKGRRLTRLVAVPDGATQWQIQSNPQPPLFWVTIQDGTGAHIAQVDDGPLMLYEGPLNINDHTAQWRFIMVGDGLEYTIENRATGFLFGTNATADRNDATFHWMLSSAESGSVKLINAGSKKLVFRAAEATITIQPVGYSSYENAPGGSVPCHKCDWHLKPAYDDLPSFAIVNSYTGRCVTNDPIPNIGTVSTANNVNDFRSQWYFHAQSANGTVNGTVNDLPCVLSSKISGNSLEVCHKEEIRVEAYNDHRQNSSVYSSSLWGLLPLSTHLLALHMSFGPGFLYDTGESNLQAQNPPRNIQSFYWYLASHREPGFDFISLESPTMEQLSKYLSSKPSETPWNDIQRYFSGGRAYTSRPDSIVKFIPLANTTPFTTDATIRLALAFLIAQWTENSISKTSTPRIVLSATREDIEKQWGMCLSEHALRRSSDQAAWIQVGLQGVYDVDGTWVAVIQGQWLDTPVFRVVVPAEVQVSYVVIQRAMLQSLNQGFAVQVRATPSSPAAVPSENTRLDVVCDHGSKAFVAQPSQPSRPSRPSRPGHMFSSVSYDHGYREAQATYNSNLEAYKSSPYWKLRSSDMRLAT